jgi:hypothetical protein
MLQTVSTLLTLQQSALLAYRRLLNCLFIYMQRGLLYVRRRCFEERMEEVLYSWSMADQIKHSFLLAQS